MNPYFQRDGITIHNGSVLDELPKLPDQSVQCCVTSPPYWGLRDYDCDGQLGIEKTPQQYVEQMVKVFREVGRVLRDDGTLWLNLGDSYANDTKWGGSTGGKHAQGLHGGTGIGRNRHNTGLPSKSLIGIPWRVALALQEDGWILRSDIIWHKPNPMPGSYTDRPTTSHEHIFLLAKSELYYYDHEAIAEPALTGNNGSQFHTGKTAENQHHCSEAPREDRQTRNKRDVWTVPTVGYKGAHFAVFPPKLITPCILAGTKESDNVLDPFMGSGTTALVSMETGRQFTGVELNSEYCDLAIDRLKQPVLF